MTERQGLTISGVAGLLAGLAAAWLIWHEAPPPRTLGAPAQPVAGAPETPQAADEAANVQTASVDPAQAEPADKLSPEELNISLANEVAGHLVQDLGDDRKVELTIIPALQKRAASIMSQAEVPYGALVAMEPDTGRVLAYAEHSAARPDLSGLCGMANPPAASVFKVVTTAALLEQARVPPETKVCFHGGHRGISQRHLVDNPKLDTRCHTLAEALGKSTNAVFGKLAYKHLDPDVLLRYSRRFFWDREIPFVFPIQTSHASFDSDRVLLAKTAAGFYNTQLSPMHGALIASAIANDGLMMAPKLVERYVVGNEERTRRGSTPMGRAIRPRTARLLANMMVTTTETGTASAYFRKRGKSLRGIRVAAKTGSLSTESGEDAERHHFSWWIGFAPAENPRVAVAALVVNVGPWRIKSTYLAREVLETYFETVAGQDVTSR